MTLLGGGRAGRAQLGTIVMMSVNPTMNETPFTAARLDPESAEWLGALSGTGPRREAALARLHGMLVRNARGGGSRRGPRLPVTRPALPALAYQAPADAMLAITPQIAQVRGGSRFTTWAVQFVL